MLKIVPHTHKDPWWKLILKDWGGIWIFNVGLDCSERDKRLQCFRVCHSEPLHARVFGVWSECEQHDRVACSCLGVAVSCSCSQLERTLPTCLLEIKTCESTCYKCICEAQTDKWWCCRCHSCSAMLSYVLALPLLHLLSCFLVTAAHRWHFAFVPLLHVYFSLC